MRNYVFISNKNAFDIIEEHLNGYTIPTASLEVSKNAKGKVIHFYNSYWALRLCDFVQDQRNMIAFDIMVLPLSQDEKRSARDTVRSLTRIADELTLVGKQLKEKEVSK
jgi:hypothetical protein